MSEINKNYETQETLKALKDSGLSIEADNIVSDVRDYSTDVMNDDVPGYKQFLSKFHTKPKLDALKVEEFNWLNVIASSQPEVIKTGDIEIKQTATIGNLMWTLSDLWVSNDDTAQQEESMAA